MLSNILWIKENYIWIISLDNLLQVWVLKYHPSEQLESGIIVKLKPAIRSDNSPVQSNAI